MLPPKLQLPPPLERFPASPYHVPTEPWPRWAIVGAYAIACAASWVCGYWMGRWP